MTAYELAGLFAVGRPYADYVRTGTEEQQRRWNQLYDCVKLTQAQEQLLSGFVRTMNVLVVSGIWCGDCVQQCPIFAHFAEASPSRIDLRFVDRDECKTFSQKLKINGGDRVPVVLFMAEDHELCGIYGDRTLNRYRALAAKQLGHSCPSGIVPPGPEELQVTAQDWLNEFERMQLMLRLSGRLRQRHQD